MKEEIKVQEVIIQGIMHYGYICLFLFMVLENIFPPIPSEIILTFAGFMVAQGRMTLLGVIVSGTCGSFLGGYILYFTGQLMTPQRLTLWLKKPVFKYLHFDQKDINKAQQWFDLRGYKVVFFGRLIPGVRSFISIPAGMAQMPCIQYSLYTLLGTLLWDIILVFLGYVFHQQWILIVDYIQQYSGFIKIISLCLITGWIIRHCMRK